MSDQAHRLRALMHNSAALRAPRHADAPWMIAVAAGKGGVGSTTVGVNLAIALAWEGHRSLIVDGNLQRADVATQCGLTDGNRLADVLAKRKTLHESLQRGPGGTQALTGRWAPTVTDALPPGAFERLLYDLRGLAPHTDFVIFDTGTAVDSTAQQIWKAADQILLVTSPDSVAVMATYAAAKMIASAVAEVRLATVVNHGRDASESAEAHARLQRACRRFLGVETQTLGTIQRDAQVCDAASTCEPVLSRQPTGPAARDILSLASALVVLREQHRTAAAATGKLSRAREVAAGKPAEITQSRQG